MTTRQQKESEKLQEILRLFYRYFKSIKQKADTKEWRWESVKINFAINANYDFTLTFTNESKEPWFFLGHINNLPIKIYHVDVRRGVIGFDIAKNKADQLELSLKHVLGELKVNPSPLLEIENLYKKIHMLTYKRVCIETLVRRLGIKDYYTWLMRIQNRSFSHSKLKQIVDYLNDNPKMLNDE